VKGGWRKLHDVELYDLRYSPDIILVINSRMRWVECVVHMGKRNVYKILVWKS
jgi:hypothetical protein